MAEGASSNLIGQFGVGFYSAFLAADKVTVTSKHNDDPKQWVWESTAANGFSITEDPKGNTLGRGTRITLHLRAETEEGHKESEYLSTDHLKTLVRKYSEFINFPIYLWSSHEEAIDEEEELLKEAEKLESEDVEEEEEDEEAEEEEEEDEEAGKPPKTKTVWEWELINSTKPIWTRSASEVTEDEYYKFYKAVSKVGIF